MAVTIIRRSDTRYDIRGSSPISYAVVVNEKSRLVAIGDAIVPAGLSWPDYAAVLAVLSCPTESQAECAKSLGVNLVVEG